MADPVAELEGLISLEVDKSSLKKVSKEIESLRKSIKGVMTDESGRHPLAENLKATTRQYKSTFSQIKKAFGANDRQARTIINETLGIDKGNLGFKLAQQSDVKAKRTKQWTLKELDAKEEEYQRLKTIFTGKGLSGGQVIAKMNKELGPNFIQERGRRKAELEQYRLMKKENKERKKSLSGYKQLGSVLKTFGVGASVATIVNKIASSDIRAGGNKLNSLYGYGGASKQVWKDVVGVLGGDTFSNEQIEKTVDEAFTNIMNKTQNLPSIGSDIKSMAIATMGKGTGYIQRYAQLIAEGARTGKPKFDEIISLANEIAGSNLSVTNKRALMNQMIGSDELTSLFIENASMGGKDVGKLYKKYRPSALAGENIAREGRFLKQDINETEKDIGRDINVKRELDELARNANQKSNKKFGFWKALTGDEEYESYRRKEFGNLLKERSKLIPILRSDKYEDYRAELGYKDIIPEISGKGSGGVSIQNNIYGITTSDQINEASRLTREEVRNVNTRNMQGGKN